jgi:hypothetical protein
MPRSYDLARDRRGGDDLAGAWSKGRKAGVATRVVCVPDLDRHVDERCAGRRVNEP